MGKMAKLIEKLSNIHIPVRSIENLKHPSPKQIEIRRRNQFYTHLNLLLSQISFFDFFTRDSLQILVIAKKLAKFFKQEEIDEDLFLLAFFFHDSKILYYLKEKGITKKTVLAYYLEKNNIQGLSKSTVILKKIDYLLKAITFPITKAIDLLFPLRPIRVKMKASYELLKFFEEVAELAAKTYKTPAISEKILLLALLEGKPGKFLSEKLKAQSQETWLFVRYKIVKSIYADEFPIKNALKRPQYQYGYLLRLYVRRKNLDFLFVNRAFEASTEFFRTHLLKYILSRNFLDIIEKDTMISMSLRKNRKYSSPESEDSGDSKE